VLDELTRNMESNFAFVMLMLPVDYPSKNMCALNNVLIFALESRHCAFFLIIRIHSLELEVQYKVIY